MANHKPKITDDHYYRSLDEIFNLYELVSNSLEFAQAYFTARITAQNFGGPSVTGLANSLTFDFSLLDLVTDYELKEAKQQLKITTIFLLIASAEGYIRMCYKDTKKRRGLSKPVKRALSKLYGQVGSKANIGSEIIFTISQLKEGIVRETSLSEDFILLLKYRNWFAH